MPATIKEIAKLANVDKSTVSRALNDSPLIPAQTKEKIVSIARELNYFPNSLARGLVSHKSETVGIILPNIFFLQGPFFSEVLRGIESACVKVGYNILIASATGKTKEKNFPFNLTRAKRIDGMLIINEEQRVHNLIAMRKENIPFVFINRYIDDPDINCVAADNKQGGQIAIRHLTNLGHRRIAAVTGSFKIAASLQRLEGYHSCLKENGIAFDPKLIQEGMFDRGIESGIECASRLLNLNDPPTAIFAFSDEIAMGVMQAVREKGLRIPEDMAVIGYDNIGYSAHLNPPLTTISQNPFAIGEQSCQMLIDILNEKKIEKNHIHVPVELIVRESCGFNLHQSQKK
jgi:DNA-binding LacI/PurR family transcriptional regulator